MKACIRMQPMSQNANSSLPFMVHNDDWRGPRVPAVDPEVWRGISNYTDEIGDARNRAKNNTLANKVIATVPIGQAPQALTYVPDAVRSGLGKQNLRPFVVAGQAGHLAL